MTMPSRCSNLSGPSIPPCPSDLEEQLCRAKPPRAPLQYRLQVDGRGGWRGHWCTFPVQDLMAVSCHPVIHRNYCMVTHGHRGRCKTSGQSSRRYRRQRMMRLRRTPNAAHGTSEFFLSSSVLIPAPIRDSDDQYGYATGWAIYGQDSREHLSGFLYLKTRRNWLDPHPVALLKRESDYYLHNGMPETDWPDDQPPNAFLLHRSELGGIRENITHELLQERFLSRSLPESSQKDLDY